MTRRIVQVVIPALLVCGWAGTLAATEREPAPPAPATGAEVRYHQSLLVDPNEFFGVLVRRYRGLVGYADHVRLVQTIVKEGDAPYLTDRLLICEIDDTGGLSVRTAAREARDAFRLSLPLKGDAALLEMRRRYDLWLMPHMVLKYAEEPLREFREGVEGFTATDAVEVTVDEKPMVQVTLRAGDAPADAEFDLFVNPDSMLIERIVGEQRLPDGGSLETTLEITPVVDATAAAPAPAPTPPPSAPGATPPAASPPDAAPPADPAASGAPRLPAGARPAGAPRGAG